MSVMIVLNLAVWTLGAELLYPDRQIRELDDLPRLLSSVLGEGGRWLFYIGIFSAIYTSILGHASGLGLMGSHAGCARRPAQRRSQQIIGITGCIERSSLWCLISPLIWTLPGMPDFVTLTLVANSAQVVLLPLLAGGLWWITASSRYIGPAFRNRWWENVVMSVLFALAIYGAFTSVRSIAQFLNGG